MLPRPPKVRSNSFVTQPLDLLSWFYVYLLDFDLFCNLIHHLASYPVSVRRLVDFATPHSLPRYYCCRLALRYTWRKIPVTGLSPEKNCTILGTRKKTPPNLNVLRLGGGVISRVFV